MEPIEILRAKYPWPDTKPGLGMRPEKHAGWLNDYTAAMLKRLSAHATLIVELGTWTGKSARFLCDHNPNATVIGIDHFIGSREHQDAHHADVLPILYLACINRCWEYRKRLILIEEKTHVGMSAVHGCGLKPELVYIDASHEEEDVARDIQVASTFWPNAVLCGDDWNVAGLQRAVEAAATRLNRPLWHDTRAWSIE